MFKDTTIEAATNESNRHKTKAKHHKMTKLKADRFLERIQSYSLNQMKNNKRKPSYNSKSTMNTDGKATKGMHF